MSDLTAEAEGLLHGGREDMTLRRVMELLQRKRIIRKGQAERDVGALATLLGYTVTHIPGGEYLIWPLGQAGDVPPYIGGLSLRGAAAWLIYRDARETLQTDWDNKLGLVSSRGSDTRQWRVQDGGSEADGFYVVGYNPYQTTQFSGRCRACSDRTQQWRMPKPSWPLKTHPLDLSPKDSSNENARRRRNGSAQRRSPRRNSGVPPLGPIHYLTALQAPTPGP